MLRFSLLLGKLINFTPQRGMVLRLGCGGMPPTPTPSIKNRHDVTAVKALS